MPIAALFDAPTDGEPGHTDPVDLVTAAVMRRLEARSNYFDHCAREPRCTLRVAKVRRAVAAKQPLEMVILGFPAKSPNRRKTLGEDADLGEVEGLRTLHTLCLDIAQVHAPGAVVHICSDGHVFADLVHVADAAVDRFQTQVAAIISEFGFATLRTFSANHVFPGVHGDALRARISAEYGGDVAAARRQCLATDDGRALWNGIHRFLFEDDVALFPELSRNQLRERSKQRAYQVVYRSQAFSNLVAAAFPEAVRLSIHPSSPSAHKLGVRLVPSQDRWSTPWHNVLVLDTQGPRLMPHARARDLGARLAYQGRYAYFEVRP